MRLISLAVNGGENGLAEKELSLKNKNAYGVIVVLSRWSGIYFSIFVLIPFFVMD